MKEPGQAPESPIWVDTAAGLRAMLVHLRSEPALAVDTESNSLYAYQEQVCLIQISVPGTDYLLDPLAVNDLSGLGPLLASPEVLKVLHGAEYDLTVLQRDYDFRISNLFDTMWASRILGWPAHGLAALLRSHFGVRLNKKYQRANWALRPLPPEQLDYARLDTHYLLRLQEIQARELEELGRWRQAQHRFSKLAETRWETKSFDPDGFWQISGARDLDDVGRGVLSKLYLFREEYAQALDRPPFKVMSNKAMLALSDRRPSDIDGLRQVKGVPGWLVHKRGRALLRAIRQGERQPLPWSERPRPAVGSNRTSHGRPSAACHARFEALRSWRNTTAKARGVEPDIVLSNQELWAVAWKNPRNQGDLSRNGLLARWQVDEFGRDLLGVLKKRR